MNRTSAASKSPAKTYAKSPRKSELARTQLENEMPLARRLSLMRQQSNVEEADLAEYRRTELIRKSVSDVKTRA